MRKRICVLGVAIIAALAITGCGASREASFQGYVEGEFVYLGASLPGRLEHLAAARGNHVDAGALLFELESTEERAQQRQAQQQLEAAQAQLADLKTGKRAPEVAVIHAQLMQARASAQKSALQRERDEAQFRAGGISREQLEAIRAQASSDTARVQELESQEEVARLPSREQQVAAQSDQVRAAQAVLAQADWRVDQKAVSAPQAGRVYDTLFREGEWVAAGSPVVRLLPPQNIKVRFFVPEPLLARFPVGGRVTIHCDGCPADLPAQVTYVSAEAEYTPPVIYSNETRGKLVYMIEAHPSPSDAVKLRPGQPLAVRLP